MLRKSQAMSSNFFANNPAYANIIRFQIENDIM
jgi:hypothetical protein